VNELTDRENLLSKFDTVDWNALLSDLEDIDEMCNTFTETFLRVARECIPTKMVTVRNIDRPWFNSELRGEIRKRDRIRKTANKNKANNQISTNTRSRERKLMILKRLRQNISNKI
jgi:uncharacterized protein YacL (UPF0231 family)